MKGGAGNRQVLSSELLGRSLCHCTVLPVLACHVLPFFLPTDMRYSSSEQPAQFMLSSYRTVLDFPDHSFSCLSLLPTSRQGTPYH